MYTCLSTKLLENLSQNSSIEAAAAVWSWGGGGPRKYARALRNLPRCTGTNVHAIKRGGATNVCARCS